MKELVIEIEMVVKQHLRELLNRISYTYSIPIDELTSLIDGDADASVIDKPSKHTDVKQTCTYEFTRGAKKGTLCGSVCKSQDTDNCCTKHKSKKVAATPPPAVVVESVDPSDAPVVLRKNKSINKLCHMDTQMVFESAENRVVIGKLQSDNTIEPLSIDDVLTCETMGFQYKKDPVVVVAPVKDPGVTKIYDIEELLNNLQTSSIDDISEEYT